MFALAWTAALLLASSPAMAAVLGRRDTTASCTGLPDGSNGSLSYPFTLLAYNESNTAIPLYLTYGVPSRSPAASEWVVATALASAETSNLYPSFNLSDGYLTPQAAAGTTPGIVPWVTPLQAGDPFTLLQAIGSPYPASIFCAADVSAEYPVLSINNNADGFSICASVDDYDLNIVAYEPVDGSSFYTLDSCYPVHLSIVPYTA
ncbi:hypothetical protein FOMPIDRAFT_155458 [Fomitopsis schrenkii]|uniref:Ubiquitin 3 binding protein But2 C-terminal domain-containing protein n=1 Tax=Fomitopsis schrenkii TaxID=2126942 RepID=S8EGE6_FOMSC|nr:hypothetical protein FOMPIDRAFT_155458 [Fomitopsis schrenkii]